MQDEPWAPCIVCGRWLSPSEIIKCDRCLAVAYCGVSCQRADWTSLSNPDHAHEEWCSRMKVFMQLESVVCTLPLSFSRVTTSRSFSQHQFEQFLSSYGLFRRGLWKYEFFSCSDSTNSDVVCPGSELPQFAALFLNSTNGLSHGSHSSVLAYEDAMLRAYVLPMESIIMCLPPATTGLSSLTSNPTLVTVELLDWAAYYRWRGLACERNVNEEYDGFSCPLAIILHWPLTLYFILARLLPDIAPSTLLSVRHRSTLTIHIIGVEHELSMLPVFKELDYLISPSLAIHLVLIGPNLDPSVDGQSFLLSPRLFVLVLIGVYDRVAPNLDVPPDVIVGFNSGLSAYSSWTSTIQFISSLAVPCFFTDACLYSCTWGYRVVARLKSERSICHRPDLSSCSFSESINGYNGPVLNPFRSPIRLHSAGVLWGWFKNAFIYAPFHCPSYGVSSSSVVDRKLLIEMEKMQL